jgi:hypothetical protein
MVSHEKPSAGRGNQAHAVVLTDEEFEKLVKSLEENHA